MEDLNKLYPGAMPDIPMSKMMRAALDKKLAYLCKALQSVRDSWMKSHQKMTKFSYESSGNMEKLVGIVLATLDCIIEAVKELFDMKEENFTDFNSSYTSPDTTETLKPLDVTYSSSKVGDQLANDSCSNTSGKPLKVEAEKHETVEEFNAVEKQVMNKSNMNEITADRGKAYKTGKANAGPVPTKGSMQPVPPPPPPPMPSKVSMQPVPPPPPPPPVPSKGSMQPVPSPPPPPPVTLQGSMQPVPKPPPPPLAPSKSSMQPVPPPPPPMPSKVSMQPVPPPPPPMPSKGSMQPVPPPPSPPPVPSKGSIQPVSSPAPAPAPMTAQGSMQPVPKPPPPPLAPSKYSMQPVPPPPPPPPPVPSKASMQQVPPPPPPPVPSKGSMQPVAPPPPPPPLTPSKGSVPAPPLPMKRGPGPPPPPPLSVVRTLNRKGASAKLKRSTQMSNLFRDLKGKMEGNTVAVRSTQGSKKQLGGSSGGKQGMAQALAELTKRSSYFQQIEEDIKNHSKTIMELKVAISSFKAKDMVMLVKFQKSIDFSLEVLSDESQVLARFEDFPTKKLEALRAAAALYSKLDLIVVNLKKWEIMPPLEQLLTKFECYFSKVKVEVDALERIKDEEAKKFKSQNIDFDFNMITMIKELMVNVSSSCLELALKEKREAKAATRGNEKNGSKIDEQTKGSSVKLLWRTFKLAFRVYSFAGGQDDHADKLTRKLANEIFSHFPNS